MWIKLSKSEIYKNKRKYFYKHFLAYFLLIFITTTLAHKFGCSKTGLSLPVEWSNLLYDLPILLLISLLVSIIWSLYETRIPESLMCDKCFKYKKNDRNYNCDCGGQFIDFRNMKYINNKE